MTEAQYPFLTRRCRISTNGGPDEELEIMLFKPQKVETGEYVAMARLRCSFFDVPMRVAGGDEVQAFSNLLLPTLAYLRRLNDAEGYDIWWVHKDDLGIADFWSYQET